MPGASLSPSLVESRGIAWPCCPTTSCVWRSLPYRALGATAPDLRPPGRWSPPPQKRKTSFHVFPPALERTRAQLDPAVFRCAFLVFASPSYSRGAPCQHCTMPSSRHEGWRIENSRRLARLRLRHQRANPAHRSLSRRRGRDAAEMRPRCGRDAACMGRDAAGESLSPHLRLGGAGI